MWETTDSGQRIKMTSLFFLIFDLEEILFFRNCMFKSKLNASEDVSLAANKAIHFLSVFLFCVLQMLAVEAML